MIGPSSSTPLRDITNYTKHGKPPNNPSSTNKNTPSYLDSGSGEDDDAPLKQINLNLTSDNDAKKIEIDRAIQQIVRDSILCDSALADLNRNAINSAFNKLLLLAQNGFPKAQYFLGRMYEVGNEVIEQDLDKAQMWYEKAVSKNFKSAFNALVSFYFNDSYPQHNDQRAMELFQAAMQHYKQAVQRGDLTASEDIEKLNKTIMTSACEDWEKGKYPEALSKFELLLKEDHEQAKLINAVRLNNDINHETKMHLMDALIPIIRKDDKGLMSVFIGYLYLNGYVVEQDLEQANDLFKKAKNLGVTGAFTYIGHTFLCMKKYQQAALYNNFASDGGRILKAAPNIAHLKEMAQRRS